MLSVELYYNNGTSGMPIFQRNTPKIGVLVPCIMHLVLSFMVLIARSALFTFSPTTGNTGTPSCSIRDLAALKLLSPSISIGAIKPGCGVGRGVGCGVGCGMGCGWGCGLGCGVGCGVGCGRGCGVGCGVGCGRGCGWAKIWWSLRYLHFLDRPSWTCT